MSRWKQIALVSVTTFGIALLPTLSGCQPDTQSANEDKDNAADQSSSQIDIDVPGADVEIRTDKKSGGVDVDVKNPE